MSSQDGGPSRHITAPHTITPGRVVCGPQYRRVWKASPPGGRDRMRYPVGSPPPAAIRSAGGPTGMGCRMRSNGWTAFFMKSPRATTVAD